MLYDKDIREPLFEYLEEQHGKCRILEEKQMGKSRADIVMVLEDAIVGIEIKSDADTYVRLERQVKDYDVFFDYNIVVAGSTHAQHISEHVPEYWGIITAEEMKDGVDFYPFRAMSRNPKMKLDKKLSLLWRPELAHIQEITGMAKYKNMSKQFVIEKISEKIPEETLAVRISEELLERDYTAIADTINAFRAEQNKKPRRKVRRRRSRRLK